MREGRKTVECKPVVSELIKAMGETEETVIVAINGKIVTSDVKIKPKDNIKIIPVVSGG